MTASEHNLPQIQENLRDITECSICKETFRDPRILSCIHTFCKKCLEATASESTKQPGSTIPCPMCRHEFVVPAKGVDELQKNFFMVKLIDMTKHLAFSSNPPLCDVCPEDNADTVLKVENTLAELFCRNCTLRLCSNCVRHHKRSKLTSTHVLVQLDDCSLAEKMSEILVSDKCEKHGKEHLKLHCTDCQAVVCALCFIEEHSTHKWSDVGKAADKFRQRIKTNVENLSKQNSKLNSKMQELEKVKTDNNRNLSDLEKTINERKSLLHGVIEKHANSLIEELGMRRKENLKEIKLEEENIELQLANQRSYADYCLELAANGSALDICRSEKDLNARAEDLHRLCQSLCQRKFEPIALRCNMPTVVDELMKNKDKNFIGEISKEVRGSSLVTSETEGIRLWGWFFLIVPVIAVFVVVCLRHYNDHYRNTSDVCDCSDIKANGYKDSGVYVIYVVDEGQRYYAAAFCDMTTRNGPWTVFQRREDGSVDFYRDWNDYANGFGNPSGEFWLGNNFLHLLTSKRRYRLRIDLEDFEGEKRYAEYSTFNISSSTDKYRLSIETYSGSAGDSLTGHHNGHRFSTKDNDNDAWSSGSCAVVCRGAWWYNDCSDSNLNGLYLRGRYSSNGSFNGWEGVRWGHWYDRWYSLKTTEMKISS